MWIAREEKKRQFIKLIQGLKNQVLLVRGARQVGKTSFILNALKEISCPQIKINLAFKTKGDVYGETFYGRDYFGKDEEAGELLTNLAFTFGSLDGIKEPILIFIDEVDRHPVSLEAIQKLAGLSDKLKVVYTGSNLENITVKNAATGRKQYFDLYPITFTEFLKAYHKEEELKYLWEFSFKQPLVSEYLHGSLTELFDLYLRLGGMPQILDAFLDPQNRIQSLPSLVSDLVNSIEENVKIILGEKSHLYEYEDVLRKMALLSTETLKFSRLQVSHAGRNEAKKLVNKTVGARVAHKIRLYEAGFDLSKYIIFDSGVLNHLLNGSDLLRQKITSKNLAIMYENSVGNEMIARFSSRDDMFYWKSKRGAQVEYLVRSPHLMALDVKTTRGDTRSLDSSALFEKEIACLIKVSREKPQWHQDHVAKLPNSQESRPVPLMIIPHYLAFRVQELFSLIHSPPGHRSL